MPPHPFANSRQVAYIDPGNWAAAIEAGSRFGYQLVWVVVLSNIIAIVLQTLAARLGLVTGKHLAQVGRGAEDMVTGCMWLRVSHRGSLPGTPC